MSEKYGPMLAGYGFALGATALWSGNFIVARGLNDQIPPVSLAFYRWLTAVLVFAGVICLITRGELNRILAIRLYAFQFTLFSMGLMFLLPFFLCWGRPGPG